MTEANPFLVFSDSDLKSAFQRAIRTVLILTLILAPIVGFASGWGTAALLAVGAAVSAGSLSDWG